MSCFVLATQLGGKVKDHVMRDDDVSSSSQTSLPGSRACPPLRSVWHAEAFRPPPTVPGGLLDLTALGRQEAWEEPKGRAPVLHDT